MDGLQVACRGWLEGLLKI